MFGFPASDVCPLEGSGLLDSAGDDVSKTADQPRPAQQPAAADGSQLRHWPAERRLAPLVRPRPLLYPLQQGSGEWAHSSGEVHMLTGLVCGKGDP